MPPHGTTSRKLREGVRRQINKGQVAEAAVLFLIEKCACLTEIETDGTPVNTYRDMDKTTPIGTLSQEEKA